MAWPGFSVHTGYEREEKRKTEVSVWGMWCEEDWEHLPSRKEQYHLILGETRRHSNLPPDSYLAEGVDMAVLGS